MTDERLPGEVNEDEIDDDSAVNDPVLEGERIGQRTALLPGAESLDKPTLGAIEATRGMTVETLTPKIGVAPFVDWYIAISRVEPRSWNGQTVEECKIMHIHSGMTWPDIQQAVLESNGGGGFVLKVHDNSGVVRKQKTFRLPAAPKWPKDRYPLFADIGLQSDPEVTARMKELEQEKINDQVDEIRGRRDARKLDTETRKAEITGNSMAQMFLWMKTQQESSDKRHQEQMEAFRERERALDAENKANQNRVTELLTKKDDGGMAQVMSMMMQQGNNTMTLMQKQMDLQREIAQENARAERDHSMQMLNMTMRMFEAQGNGNSGGLNDKVFELMNQMNEQKFRVMDTLYNKALEMSGNQTPEDNPFLELGKLALSKLGDVGEILRNAVALQNSTRRRPQITPGAAPQPPPQPTPQPAPQPAPQPPQDEMAVYRNADFGKKVNMVCGALIQDTKSVPLPTMEQSVFMRLVTDESTPDMMFNFIANLNTAVTAKPVLLGLIKKTQPPERQAIIFPEMDEIFGNPAKAAFVDECLKVLDSMMEEDAPAPEPTVTVPPAQA